MASCVSCNDGKDKKEVTCCGGTITETTTKVTKTGGALCEMPTGAVQYIGARYIPVFADPVEWSADKPYEHLMMVQNRGNTYISKQAVPVGVPLPTPERSNDYWVLMSDWNAQIEQYREEVELFDSRITDTETDIADIKPRLIEAETDIDNIEPRVSDAEEAIDALEDRMNAAEDVLDELTEIPVIVVIGDSWSDGADEWVSKLSARMDNYRFVNCAAPGTGFITGGRDFVNQSSTYVDNQLQTLGIKAELVSHVIVIGGVNDYRCSYTYQDLSSAINTTFSNIQSRFPRAKKYYGMNCGIFTMMDSIDVSEGTKMPNYRKFPEWATLIYNRIRAFSNSGVTPLFDFWWVLNSFAQDMDNVFKEDLLHPSPTGSNIIANYLESVINGVLPDIHGDAQANRTDVYTIDGSDVNGNLRVCRTIDGTDVKVRGILSFESVVTPSTNVEIDVTPFFGNGTFGGAGKNIGVNCHDFYSITPVTAYWRTCGNPTYANPVGNDRYLRIYLRAGQRYRDIHFEGDYDAFGVVPNMGD